MKPKPKKITMIIQDTNVATGSINFEARFSPGAMKNDTAATQLAVHLVEAAANYIAANKQKGSR